MLVLLLVPALAIVGAAFLKMATLEGDRTRAQEQTAQSIYYAEGGVARAQWALIAKAKLDKVDDNMPTGMTACTANQGGVTSGSVDWTGANITITATGTAGAFSRKVQTQVNPSGLKLNLKNVITSPGNISISSPNPPSVISTVNGPVVTGDASTDLSSVQGVHPVTVTSVATLDVQACINSVLSQYSETVVTGPQLDASTVSSPFVFNGSSGTAVYFSNDPGLWIPSGNPSGCISVQGECIWVIQGGAQFGKDFIFTPVGVNPRLLLLISKDPSNGKGIDIEKVVDGSNLPIVLVTDGAISFNKECSFLDVALYGSTISAAKGQDFLYDPTVLDPFIDSLNSRDLLPSVAGSTTGTVAKVTGTWSELP